MECGLYIPSVPFVVLTVNQFVGRGGGSLERQKQDSHVFEKLVILPHRRSTTVSLETYRRDFCESCFADVRANHAQANLRDAYSYVQQEYAMQLPENAYENSLFSTALFLVM